MVVLPQVMCPVDVPSVKPVQVITDMKKFCDKEFILTCTLRDPSNNFRGPLQIVTDLYRNQQFCSPTLTFKRWPEIKGDGWSLFPLTVCRMSRVLSETTLLDRTGVTVITTKTLRNEIRLVDRVRQNQKRGIWTTFFRTQLKYPWW